jgi:hypothetical protein
VKKIKLTKEGAWQARREEEQCGRREERRGLAFKVRGLPIELPNKFELVISLVRHRHSAVGTTASE